MISMFSKKVYKVTFIKSNGLEKTYGWIERQRFQSFMSVVQLAIEQAGLKGGFVVSEIEVVKD